MIGREVAVQSVGRIGASAAIRSTIRTLQHCLVWAGGKKYGTNRHRSYKPFVADVERFREAAVSIVVGRDTKNLATQPALRDIIQVQLQEPQLSPRAYNITPVSW